VAARVLVVSADPALRSLVAESLRREGYELLDAADGREGLRRWSADRPELVAVDGALPGKELPEMVSLIREAEPPGTHVPIIVIGEKADVESRIGALRLGADDYLARAARLVELPARARALLARFPVAATSGTEPVLGRVHPFYGAGGGVGTTTLAINTAIAIQRDLKHSVVLVDGNLQFGDHRVFLDLGPDKRSIVDAVTATAIDQEVLRQVVVHHDSGMHLLLAPPNPEAAEQVSAESHHMLRIVEVLRTMYDFVIVDLESRLDDHTLDVLGAADAFFVVINADLSSFKNVHLLLETMNQIGIPEDRMKIVLNRSNAFTGISVKSIETVVKRPLAHQVINDYRTAISALNSGTPFMVGRPESALSKAVLRFALDLDRQGAHRESVEHAEKGTAPAPTRVAARRPRTSLFGRRAESRH
jgi:pilus assembly protein CpaE